MLNAVEVLSASAALLAGVLWMEFTNANSNKKTITISPTHSLFLFFPLQRKPRDTTPPESKGYPSFAEKAQNFKLGGGKISGGAAGRTIEPVFVHPTLNTEPVPDFDYKEAGKLRTTPQSRSDYVYDDGLTVLERKQKGTIPAFLTGSARSKVVAEPVRDDIEEQEYPFGLTADRFQLLFISVFSLFALVGCLSGNISFD
uniref:Uncharacterized protein n=1 Tax=Pseudo-nitzschia australis TaxID=44445 RepID=A0A7S4ALB5_9STRA|mmetsp:Transcript_679/g.1526  ORF Transcript_679/g.1526 Transcript_679/m.1526 type:complete len:200 (-) Transcript_679:436-1035(-)|eukprot:CAMPEP_0168166944 /NCGR_PEP_ID=MMETSP0139_2-20121125/2294_1 /TAXON_ID=44445 /ORGANISM="Pseudo-nitzschia australis, Strain 10249 10 AB" /LENGTH=199 /DNA_ID=CAMNT_0008084169 /DNA_START=470 /DNA_END=1069 /DNA_ORIENTATION=+